MKRKQNMLEKHFFNEEEMTNVKKKVMKNNKIDNTNVNSKNELADILNKNQMFNFENSDLNYLNKNCFFNNNVKFDLEFEKNFMEGNYSITDDKKIGELNELEIENYSLNYSDNQQELNNLDDLNFPSVDDLDFIDETLAAKIGTLGRGFF